MSKTEYLLQVQVAATGKELREIYEAAQSDKEIRLLEFIELHDCIRDRYCQLNQAAQALTKPRW